MWKQKETRLDFSTNHSNAPPDFELWPGAHKRQQRSSLSLSFSTVWTDVENSAIKMAEMHSTKTAATNRSVKNGSGISQPANRRQLASCWVAASVGYRKQVIFLTILLIGIHVWVTQTPKRFQSKSEMQDLLSVSLSPSLSLSPFLCATCVHFSLRASNVADTARATRKRLRNCL